MFSKKFEYTGRIDEFIQKSLNKNKYYIDTSMINRVILELEGIKCENIIDSMICTKCNSSKIHSYREDKEASGRNTALIWKK